VNISAIGIFILVTILGRNITGYQHSPTLSGKSLNDFTEKASDMISIVTQPSIPRPAFQHELRDTAET
jgi:hypothetical protein